MSSSDPDARTGPRVLFVYFTYTQQNPRVVEAMADALRERDFEVQQALIEFTDKRYAERFSRFPLRHPWLDVLGMLVPQTRRSIGEIRIPEVARQGDYDLICFGSPTWLFTTAMPVRSYLKSDEAGRVLAGKHFAAYVTCRRYWSINLKEVKKLGTTQGGEWLDGIRFNYEGGQLRSFMSLISYLGKGEQRERYHGVKIPPTNLQPDYLEEARAFATGLADRVLGDGSSGSAPSTEAPSGQSTETAKASTHE
jgi:hypothetical protein